MSLQRAKIGYAAGIIERFDHRIVIVRLPYATYEAGSSRPLPGDEAGAEQPTLDDDPRVWAFPRGRVRPGESPEAAMRRIARSDLGVTVEVVIGQPPFVMEVDGEPAELRYFFCGIESGEPGSGPYTEVRWVSKGQLQEYDFDPPSRPVVEWLLSQP